MSIQILGKTFELPAGNFLLRGLQTLAEDTIPYGRFCWNEDCQHCRVLCYMPGAAQPRVALSCKLVAVEGLSIIGLAEELVRQLQPLNLTLTEEAHEFSRRHV
ncbi:MAG: hypothetical protein ACYC6M_11210 [Terriglobales bacterium]